MVHGQPRQCLHFLKLSLELCEFRHRHVDFRIFRAVQNCNFGLMKRSKFTEAQIIKALKDNEAGRSAAELSRELGISIATFYGWRKQYSGMEASDLKRLKDLEAENSKLKAMYAEAALDIKALKDALGKKW